MNNNFKTLCFGELLLRLSTPSHLRIEQSTSFNIDYGGAEANVAIALSNWGGETSYLTRLPFNFLGKSALKFLKYNNVDTSPSIEGGDRLGTYYLEVGIGDRGSNIEYDRANSGMSTLKTGMIDWEKVLDNIDWFHYSGITPALSQDAAKACLEGVRIAKSKGITVSCDLNYRSKLWKYGDAPQKWMVPLIEASDVVLGGKNDASILLGTKFQENDGYEDVPKRIKEQFPHLKYVATNLRQSFSATHNRISCVITDGIETYQSRWFDMPNMLDRVGGGDALMAGLIYGLQHFNNDLDKVVNFAGSSSCLKHSIKGDALICDLEEVVRLMEGQDSGLVQR